MTLRNREIDFLINHIKEPDDDNIQETIVKKFPDIETYSYVDNPALLEKGK